MARLDSRKDGFEIRLGDADAAGTLTTVEEDGGPLDRYYKFNVRGQLYAWQATCRHSIRVPAADGGVEETCREDWKLVMMSGTEVPKYEDHILAVYIYHEKPSGAANMHWFEALEEDVERASVAVIMGMLERRRRSAKEWKSGTSLLYGAAMSGLG